ncbi:hypothetical protein [Actinomadura litoris]|uniref:hypothetical protein n=1 Tax=Actinomadura litoris TaxID=2678616 RepID=UPI001FA6DDF6|nr:hypothetical protein [Actinomadura litoris]
MNTGPRPSTVERLLRDLIAALHAAYTAPSDDDPLSTADGRAAAYVRLRERGFTRKQAAWQVGVCVETGRRYETRIRNQKEHA